MNQMAGMSSGRWSKKAKAAWAAVLAACWVSLVGCDAAVSPQAEQWVRSGADALRRGDNRSAIESADRFLAMYPRAEQSAEAYYIRGVARCRLGQTDPAKADLNAALPLTRRKDLSGLIHMELGNIAYKAGDLGAAEGQFRAVLVDIPAGATPADEAAFLLGCILQRQGKWADADLFFDRVMHLFDGTDLARQAGQRVHAVAWSIQAGAFENPAPAQDLVKRLRGLALPVRIDRELRGGRMMHLVRVGTYPTFEAAQADLVKVKAVSSDAYPAPAR
jgi:tetratricopeptide (TPR) repeat protein